VKNLASNNEASVNDTIEKVVASDKVSKGKEENQGEKTVTVAGLPTN